MRKSFQMELFDGRTVDLSRLSRKELLKLVIQLNTELKRQRGLNDIDEETIERFVEDPSSMPEDHRQVVENLANTRPSVARRVALLRQLQLVERAIQSEPAEALGRLARRATPEGRPATGEA